MMVMEVVKQHMFPFRRSHDGGFLGCFMIPRQPKRQAPCSPTESSGTSDRNFFSSDDLDGAGPVFFTASSDLETFTPKLPTKVARSHSVRAPLLNSDAEATEESFVFSTSVAAPLESPSFRTLSDPLLSTFSYNSAAPVENPSLALTATSSKFGGRPHPLPPPGSPFRAFDNTFMPVFEPLPTSEDPLKPSLSPPSSSSELHSTSGENLFVSTGNNADIAAGDVGSWSIRRPIVAPVGALPLPPPEVATKLLPNLVSFAFQDLLRATRNFGPQCCMEKGDFGAVYRAPVKIVTPEGTSPRELAVVRLNTNENQRLKDWRTDVQMLSQLSDPNICLIKGYCAHEQPAERLLVFEQSPNGNLYDYLCGSRSKTQLDWPARISIVLGAARGLLYLHDRAPFQIVYREFRSSSVLLDKDYTPRLAGYGLAITSSPADKPSSFTSVMKRSQAHAKRNVLSFGVVLVELLTGKHSRDVAFQCDERSFLQWAKPYLKDEAKLVFILDPRMKGKCSMKGASKLAELALRCTHKKESRRPSMARVADTLRTIKENFSGRAEQLQGKIPSFGGVSFRDVEQRSKVVDRKFVFSDSASAGSTSSASSENGDLMCALQATRRYEDFETARAHSPRVF